MERATRRLALHALALRPSTVAAPPSSPDLQFFASHDGALIAYRSCGASQALLTRQ